MSRMLPLAAVLAAAAMLPACTRTVTVTETDRAILGAAGLATVAKVDGRSDRDILKAAALGGLAGSLCDDVRLCE